jgi:hypothetical protein
MASRRGKRRQIGWYCDHSDEVGWEANTHVGEVWKRGKWVLAGASKSQRTVSCMSGMTRYHPGPPPCPRTVPMYVIDYPEVTDGK